MRELTLTRDEKRDIGGDETSLSNLINDREMSKTSAPEEIDPEEIGRAF